MIKFKKKDLDHEFISKWLERVSSLTSSELNISAILAGFALGSVVALLFVEESSLVSAMFILSLISSWIFIISTIYHQLILESIGDTTTYIKHFTDHNEIYIHIRKIDKHSKIATFMFLIGLLLFLAVLACGGFFHSNLVGISSLITGVLLFIFVLIQGPKITLEAKILDFSSNYDELE